MTGDDQFALSTRRLGPEARVGDEGYLHTGRAQRHPDRIVVSYRHGGER